ncbi:MAG: WXG100 family type VII secretion target [Ruminococcus sp.]|nr:WXG100 family type VII secretion target [Ruminococcus sp.]
MAGNSYKVTISMLTKQCEDLKTLNERLKQTIQKMENSEGALNNMWDGEANDAFHAAFNNDKVKMMEFYNLINKYIVNLNNIAARYSQAETANTDIARTRSY